MLKYPSWVISKSLHTPQGQLVEKNGLIESRAAVVEMSLLVAGEEGKDDYETMDGSYTSISHCIVLLLLSLRMIHPYFSAS